MTHSIAVSELTNYNRVLSRVEDGNEVILTKNGTSRYAVVTIDEWNYHKAMLRFLTDMRAVDEEMSANGREYTEAELLSSIGLPSEPSPTR